MKKLFLLLLLTGTYYGAFAASPDASGSFEWPWRPRPTAPAAETTAQRVARLQVKLNDALNLQPHQLCVLHHALLAQTDPTWPDRPAAGQPHITLRAALHGILRADQLRLLMALPNQPSFAAELFKLGIQL